MLTLLEDDFALLDLEGSQEISEESERKRTLIQCLTIEESLQ